MKKKLILIAITMTVGYMTNAQTPCWIKYTYDASGNRISREYVCQTDPVVDDNTPQPWSGDPNDPITTDGVGTATGGGSIPLKSLKDTTTKEDQIEQDNFIIVFPNPTKGEFWVKFKQPIPQSKIYILDGAGKILFSTEGGEHEVFINLSSYAEGTYHVVVYDGKKNLSSKIVKQI